MNTLPTVFIFGAGVSMDFGFPSGSGLVEDICNLVEGEPFRRIVNRNQPADLDLIPEFKNRLSSSYSIDEWLEHNSKFLTLGKLAIAYRIINAEIDSLSLFKTGRNVHKESDFFYRRLWSNLASQGQDFAKADLTFITFNYDRSLEYYLWVECMRRFGMSEKLAWEHISQINIIHVHGSVGELYGTNGLEYGDDRNRTSDFVIRASKRLQIIHEDIDPNGPLMEAQNAIKLAKQVAFFGFGYHQVNLSRLGMREWSNFNEEFLKNESMKIWGSIKGLAPTVLNQRQREFFNGYLIPGDAGHGCLNFLLHTVDLR